MKRIAAVPLAGPEKPNWNLGATAFPASEVLRSRYAPETTAHDTDQGGRFRQGQWIVDPG
jgi:hypothetical protein